jgi:hypothetical protein
MILSITNIAVCTDIYAEGSAFCAWAHRDLVLWTSAVNVATDLYVVVLPINRVRKLQMSPRRKVGLAMVFASGVAYVHLLFFFFYIFPMSPLYAFFFFFFCGIDLELTSGAFDILKRLRR